MCLAPTFVWQLRGPKWEKIPTACRKCAVCRRNRVNDYVGRALCEAAYSDDVCVVTLTYAPRDDLAERVLTPSHFQRFIRSLRRAGHSVRYLVAGEYGEAKGRAHFHAVLFFKGTPPEMPHKQNFWFPKDAKGFSHWPHGHVFADWIRTSGVDRPATDDLAGGEAALRYVCKYLLKAEDGQRWFSISKKPALGHEFFMAKATEAWAADVFPASLTYMPPGGSSSRRYFMSGATRRDYLLRVLELHVNSGSLGRRGVWRPEGRWRQLNEWVLKAFDKAALWQLRRSLRDDPEALAESIEAKRPSDAAVAYSLWETSEEYIHHVYALEDARFSEWLNVANKAVQRGLPLPPLTLGLEMARDRRIAAMSSRSMRR